MGGLRKLTLQLNRLSALNLTSSPSKGVYIPFPKLKIEGINLNNALEKVRTEALSRFERLKQPSISECYLPFAIEL